MVGHRMYKERDPNGWGRGSGWYYHRGNGIWSKVSVFLDAQRNNGPMKVGGADDLYSHTHDYSSFKKAPAYPTNRPEYRKLHRRKPVTIRRFGK